MHRWYLTLAACAVCVVGGGSGVAAGAVGNAALPSGNKIYWGENGSAAISQAALDGSGGSNVNVGGATVNQETGTALDPANNRIYWVDYGTSQIWSANLDGTGGAQELYAGSADDVTGPNGIAIDPATNKIYWTNIAAPLANTIAEANLDGSGGETLLNTTGVVVSNPQGMAIDPAANKIFWGNSAQIAETNLDDTGNAHILDLTGATANQIVGVAINPATNKIYWSNAGAPKISYANLDGSGGAGDLNITGATAPVGATGVAIDPAANKIYWANKFGNKISFANLDNTGAGGDLNTTGATLNDPNYPAVLKAPSATGAPSLTGGTAAGSKLTCGQGTWAPDLLGGQLYQAPQTFTFTWKRNGSPVLGATQSTLVADAGGIYSCTVTATNVAGSAAQASTTSIKVASPPHGGSVGGNGAFVCTLTPKGTRQTVSAANPVLRLTGRCTQAVTGRLTGNVTGVLKRGKRKTFKLKSIRRSLSAGGSASLSVRLSRGALNALKQGAKESASFTLTATNANGTARAPARIKQIKLHRRHRRSAR